MHVIKGDRAVFYDCDDTLVLWDISEHPGAPITTVSCFGYESSLVEHKKNVNLLIKFKKLGYVVVVWSRTGSEWAEAVVKALGLEPYVDICISKPLFYVDDQKAEHWLGQHVYRDMPKEKAP